MSRSIIVLAGAGLALLPAAAAAQLPPETNLAMPFKGEDLAGGERWVTDVHAGDANHPQHHGKDIVAVKYDRLTLWRRFKDEKLGRGTNSNHHAWNKPIYAMAPGRVVGCWRNAPENPDPPAHSAEYKDGRIHGNGNFVIIEHDNGNRALYAHARPGTVPQALCPHNAQFVPQLRKPDGTLDRYDDGTVKPDESVTRVVGGVRVVAGQLLGRVGNSGSSSDPHLHVHIDNANRPVVMRFARGLTTPASHVEANMREIGNIDGPWTRLAGNALPLRRVLLWPARTAGNGVWNGISAGAFQRTFDHFVDSGMMPDTITCRAGDKRYDSTWVPISTAFRAHVGQSVLEHATQDAQYRAQGFRKTSDSRCDGRVAAIWRK